MPSKKVSMKASLVNRTSILGIIGGLAKGRTSGASGNRATNKLVIPRGAAAGLAYMRAHGILSRNPLGSGGVGRMNKVKSCNCQGLGKTAVQGGGGPEHLGTGAVDLIVEGVAAADNNCSYLNTDVQSEMDYDYPSTPLMWHEHVDGDGDFPSVSGWGSATRFIGTGYSAIPGSKTTCGTVSGEHLCIAAFAAATIPDDEYIAAACYKNTMYKCAAGQYNNDSVCDECPAGSSSVAGAMSSASCFKCSPGTFSMRGGTCKPCRSGTWSDAGASGASACSSGFCEPCQYTGGANDSSGCYIIDSSYCCSYSTWDVSFGCTDANHVCWLAALGQPECLRNNQNINCTAP